jgi:hypothetical protein
MGEEFYAIIKLVSGEEIMSLVMVDDTNEETVIVLQNPVTMKTFQNHQGVHIKVRPWMEMSDDDFYIIKMDKIITITETSNERIINLYNKFIDEDEYDEISVSNNSSGKIKPSAKMGYIDSVKEARKKLENIFNNSKES